MALVYVGNIYSQTPATALSFDGMNDYVNIPDNPSLNISASITLEAWIYPTSHIGTQNVICKASIANNNSYIFPRTEDGWDNVQFLLYINGQGWKALTVPYGSANLNQWHHLTATYDGYYMRIFIDGVEAGSQGMSGSITVNTNPLVISGHTGYGNEFFAGKVDDVRIWNRALSQCEIVTTMKCELALPQNGLAAYYKLNTGFLDLASAGLNLGLTTAVDETLNHNNGTLTNFGLLGTVSNWTDGKATGTCNVFTPVNATASSLQAVLPVGSTINLTAGDAGAGATYQWSGPNLFSKSGQNQTISNAGVLASGTYTVVVTNASGCSASASTIVTVAPSGKALNFDGSDNIVTIPNNTSFNTASSISLETWINPAKGTPVTQCVISKSSRIESSGFIFPRTDDGWRSFSFWLAINGEWKVLSATYPSLNQWNHVAATYDGFVMRIYLNGLLVNSLTVAGTITTNINDLTIGRQEGYTEYFKGGVDEMRIWNRALSQCEIQNNLTCELDGANNGLANQLGLNAYYRFNQGLANVNNSGMTTLADSSGKGNNGTLQGFDLNNTASNWIDGGAVNNATCNKFTQISQPIASSNGPVVEVGNTLALTASSGTSFAWTGPLAFTSNLQNPVIPSSAIANSGIYTVAITANGCTASASTFVQVANKAGSLDFDGVNDQVTVPVKPSLNISNTITLEAWLYPTNNTWLQQDVMCKSSKEVNNGYIFPRTDDAWGSYIFYLHLNGVWEKLSATYPGINQWHHVAATYDGYFMRIYLDGVQSASKEVYGTITQNDNNLLLGNQAGFNEYYQGKVEEARIWNRALNQCEIKNYMNCEPDPAIMNGLVAYYRFDQGFLNADNSQITQLTDFSNNANHGTLQNFSLKGVTSNWSDFKIGGPCSLYNLPLITARPTGTVFDIGSTIQLFASGGNSYSWNGPNVFQSSVQNPSIANAQPAATGTYTVTTPFTGCVIQTSTRLRVSTLFPLEANGPTTFCPSGSVILSSRNTGVSYQWYLNEVLIPDAINPAYTANQTGIYTEHIINASGEILVSVPITVSAVDNVLPLPDVAVLPVLNITSPGTISTFPTATDNCRGKIVGTSINPTTYVENQRGTFTITWDYNDQNGNIAHQTQQVIVTRAPDVTPPVLTVPADIIVDADITTCRSTAISFTATATDNSLDPVTITYSNNPGTSFPIGTTTVTVTATDLSGNFVKKTFNVTVLPTVVAPITGNTIVCAGSTTTLSTASTNGTWSSSNITVASVNSLGVVSGVSAGTASIIYTNKCGAVASAMVTVNAVPSMPLISVTNNCGSSVLSTTATGSLLWSTNATTSSITVLTSGTYTVTQIINGCTSAAGSGIAAPLLFPATPVVSVSNNCGSSIVSTTSTGSLLWSTNETTSSINVVTAGTYTVTQTLNGCTSAAGSGVAAPKAIQPVPVITVVNNCGSSTLSTNATGTLVWNTGATGFSIIVTIPGNYSVTATNTNGCSASSAVTAVTINTIPSVSPITGASPINVSSTLQLSDATNGGIWSSSNTSVATINASGLVTAIAAGTATINYTVINGLCSTVATVSITVNPNCTLPVISPITDITANTVTLCSAAVSYSINVTGTPSPVMSYTFTGATSFSGTGTGSASLFNKGITNVTIKANNACGTVMTSFTVTVKDITAPVISVPSDKTVSCGGSTAPSATGTATATDNCGTVIITYADVAVANSIKRTWTATDASLNTSSAVQTITLSGPFVSAIISTRTNNTYTGAPSTSLFLGYGAQSTTLQVVTPASSTLYTYAWSGTGVSMLSSNNTGTRVFTPTTAGSYLFTVVSTNSSGCQSTSYITICVTDIRASVSAKIDDKKDSDKKDDDKKTGDKSDANKKVDSKGDSDKNSSNQNTGDKNNDDKNSEDSKVYLCHVTDGSAGKTITLSISINAVAAHLTNHPGDRLGSCDQSPCGIAIVKNASPEIVATVITEVTKENKKLITEEELKVLVMPNPSTTFFTLKFESKSPTPVTLRVMDANGRLIDAKSQIGSNSTLQIGHHYLTGTYFAEIIQGSQRKVVQLIKAGG